MPVRLAKYHSRSPRYILQPQDNTLIRVAGPKETPWEEGTEIKTLSLSGLAFTAHSDLCPLVGETIKIQFEVPNGEQMACYGVVTRLEPIGTTEMLVGIQFQKLDMKYRIALLQGLARKIKEQQENKAKQQQAQFKINLKKHWPKALLAVVLFGSWLALLLYFMMMKI